MWSSVLADVVATAHVAWVAFVVFALPFILVGGARDWRWVTNRWFRGVHLTMICLVILRCFLWAECPLTTWERELAKMAEAQSAERSSFGLWMHAAIHPTVPLAAWVYHLIYTAFGALVVLALWMVPVAWQPDRQDDILSVEAVPSGGA